MRRGKLDDIDKKSGDAAKGRRAPPRGDAMKNAVDATKDAATAIVRLPNTRVIDVHEHLRDGAERRARLRRRGGERLPRQGLQRRQAARRPHRGKM